GCFSFDTCGSETPDETKPLEPQVLVQPPPCEEVCASIRQGITATGLLAALREGRTAVFPSKQGRGRSSGAAAVAAAAAAVVAMTSPVSGLEIGEDGEACMATTAEVEKRLGPDWREATTAAAAEVEHGGVTHLCGVSGCGKHFPSYHAIKSHLRCHMEASLACEACGLVFRRNHDLVRHRRSMHDAGKPHPCPHCDRAFARADALRRHQTTTSAHRCKGLPLPAAPEAVPVTAAYFSPSCDDGGLGDSDDAGSIGGTLGKRRAELDDAPTGPDGACGVLPLSPGMVKKVRADAER
ncbi:hypothetical protein HK405_006093, partial [Cladochytrium tenue]